MEPFLYYLLRASVLTVLFYGLYRLFFVHYTFHAANRFSFAMDAADDICAAALSLQSLPEQASKAESGISSMDYASLRIVPRVSDQSTFEIPWVQILFVLSFAGFLLR